MEQFNWRVYAFKDYEQGGGIDHYKASLTEEKYAIKFMFSLVLNEEEPEYDWYQLVDDERLVHQFHRSTLEEMIWALRNIENNTLEVNNDTQELNTLK